MLSRALIRIKELVHQGNFVVTLHADAKLRLERLTTEELRAVVLSSRICERQQNDGDIEWKYRLKGHTRSEIEVEVVCKVTTNNKVVIITVYRV